MINNVTVRLDCPTCNNEFRIETHLDWGLQRKDIFTCPTCGKAVLSLGLHCPDDVGLTDSEPDNCEYKVY